MKRKEFLQTAFTLVASLLLLAACAQNELADKQGEPLPEGMYPLELTAEGLQAVATPTKASTRSTFDGTWNGGEVISVQVASSRNYPSENEIPWGTIPVLTYTVAKNGTLTLNDPGKQIYWQNKSETMYIRGWYAGTKGYAGIPIDDGSWSTANVQSDDTFAQDDFLYAYQSQPFNGTSNVALEFRHMLTKIEINLIPSDYLEAANDVSVTLTNFLTEGTFRGGAKTLALVEKAASQVLSFIPKKQSVLAYEVLVIPQYTPPQPHPQAHNITVDVDGAIYKWTIARDNIVWLGGTKYTYDITVKENGLSVSVKESIGWKDGASGSGSVTLPEIIDLSTGSAEISGDGVYRIQGNGEETTNTITISSGSPTVYLENVDIKADNSGINITGGNPTIYLSATNITSNSASAVNITGGDATIYVVGSNSLYSGNGAGIFVAKDHKVKITSQNKDSNSLKAEGSGSAGIGGCVVEYSKLEDCGDITIENVTVEAKGSYNYMIYTTYCHNPAIGAVGQAACGTITITKAKVEASLGGWFNCSAAVIGGGYYDVAGSNISIVITDSEIHAHRYNEFGNYIGVGNSVHEGSQGTINGTITNSTIYKYLNDTPEGSVKYP